MIQSHIWEEMLYGYDNVSKKNLEELTPVFLPRKFNEQKSLVGYSS